jgi:hypothetical protein
MASGRVHQCLTARDITPPRPRSPGAPGATHLETNVAGQSARVAPGNQREHGRARAIRDVAIICDQALGPAWNLERAARAADTRENFAVSTASIKYEPSLDPRGRCKKDSTQDRQSIRQARRVSSRPRIFLVGGAALNVAVDRNRLGTAKGQTLLGYQTRVTGKIGL